MLSYEVAKKFLFNLDPELAHDQTLSMAQKYPGLLSKIIPSGLELKKEYKVQGHHLDWRFPLGLAAGLDKNAVALDYWDKLGFGSVEIGTVTLKPQIGNPLPRVFRYPEQKALRNSLGFPSHGLATVKSRVETFRAKSHNLNIGINIGKNKDSNFAESLEEYRVLYEAFAPLADYMVINLSSPNTPGLREFQQTQAVKEILDYVKASVDQFKTPLFLKLSPDESLSTYEKLFTLASDHKLAGFITTNTTVKHEWDKGGLSGAPLLKQNRDLYFQLMKWGKDCDLDLVLCGGFMKPEDMLPYWEQGQRFFQVYTGFIYQGPKLLKEVQHTLFNRH